KDFSTPGKKQFAEYVRILKRSANRLDADKKEDEEGVIKEPQENASAIVDTQSVNPESESKLEAKPKPLHPLGTCVTFSNPLIYQKLFENFNTNPQAALLNRPKELKLCVITNLPAKYFDP